MSLLPVDAPRARRALLAAVATLLCVGCVGRGRFEEVRDEASSLRRRAATLESELERVEAANRALTNERLRLLDEAENLRERAGAQERRLRLLGREREELDVALREREEALAARAAEIARLRGTYDALVADLESEIEGGRIELQQVREGLRLSLPSDVLFASGSATLNPAGDSVLRNVAERVKGLPHHVRVEGHTDNVPLRDPTRSNWELAGARAASVVRWLISAGVSPDRLLAVSYGEHRPIASNDTPEGRRRNRRIEIRLVPAADDSAAATPAGPKRAAR